MKWRVYIAGKVGNETVSLTDEEHQEAVDKFRRIERELLNAGFETRNPMNFVPKDVVNWQEAMKLCIPELCKCNALYLIHDFKESKGAMMEYTIANKLGFRLITPDVVEEQIRINKDKHQFIQQD
ncbi:DUF4406 domain-containing protein [Carboxylicivirga marina]|uniref:DUF4406 domain-containing protein n=1 Tax=Carboxylicivirga marina TaxID=2800988 RepID=UPI002594B375|nr:DUF4406 domain-containing protein [uncultured Carboxylicivirga sp.]